MVAGSKAGHDRRVNREVLLRRNHKQKIGFPSE